LRAGGLHPGDCQAKGALERSHPYLHGNFEAGRRFANPLDFQDQLDRWCERIKSALIAPRARPSQSAWRRSARACERCQR
jgi:hypothetical protein